MALRLVTIIVLLAWAGAALAADSAGEGSLPYDQFAEASACAECHVGLAAQHANSMMAQSFTHEWDEKEYFELALPHALKVAKVAGVKAGCNGCHAPMAFLAGDIPPQRPAAGTRANEGVGCDVCHSITGFTGDLPFNFNFVMQTGDVEQGPRPGLESDFHDIAVNPFLQSAEFCGICHNEQDPFDMWVKATHIEWRDSPYGAAGITCQECHMPRADGPLTDGGEVFTAARQHTFHGVHSPEKLLGAVEVLLTPRTATAKAGDSLTIDALVLNAKAGHMIPSGSVEERVVWLHVEAEDSQGARWHLPVAVKGFEGEHWTIADPEALAYQDIADIQGLKNFKGLKRDGDVPAGDRIYRMPYLDPQGRMTVAQWNTASFGPDYRLPPLTAVPESFTWTLPAEVAPGPVTITATVYMTMVVSSVADFMALPPSEKEPFAMNTAVAKLMVD
ncbi:MAG: hypothetical protein E4H17_02460 [Gemmatimonadales bacterium]|nr:MAG: hypothetical protein E4H17_02460 [Gemmatimonadales bacterium]